MTVAGIVETEMRAAADVDGDALGQGLEDQRMDGAVGVDEAGRVTGERMRQHVAFIHQRNDLLDDHPRIDADAFLLRPQRSEMHIDRQPEFASGLLGEFQRFQSPAGEAARFGMRLDALDQLRIFPRRLDDSRDVDSGGPVQVDVAMPEQTTG